MTAKSKEQLREQIKYVFNGGKPEPDQVTYFKVSDEGLDEIMQRIDTYYQHLYTRQDVEAICEEVVGADITLFEPVTRREVFMGDKVGIDLDADVKGSLIFIQDNGKNTLRAEQRQSIDSIIDKWRK